MGECNAVLFAGLSKCWVSERFVWFGIDFVKSLRMVN